MAFADSNRASLRSIPENSNAWGVTPATGNTREMRITGSQLAYEKDTQTSQELRSDRMTPDVIETGAMTSGSVDFELSAGAIDDFLAAFVYGAWSRPMTMDFFEGSTVSITANNNVRVAGRDAVHYFTVGRILKLSGFKTKANNRYVTISAVAYSGGNTNVTVSGTSLVVEAGSTFTRVADANDVLVMSTAIRFGTSSNPTIDSNGGNAFAAAIAAGQLKVGQKIHVDGLGMEAGTVTFAAAATAGDTVRVFDGVKVVNFQYGGVLPAGYVNVAIGADEEDSAANLDTAIRTAAAEGKISVTSSVAAGVVTVTNLMPVGGSITKSGDDITVVNFTGGDDTLRGVMTIVALTDDVITVDRTVTTNANSGTKVVVIKGSMLRNPSAVADFIRQSFTVETSYEDVEQHFVATGLRVGSFEINVQSGEIVTGSIEFMGRGMVRQPLQVSKFDDVGYKKLDAVQTEIMNATTNVGNLTKNGLELATALQSITLSGDASLRAQNAVGSKFPRGIGVGRFALTGSFTAYFETGEMFDHFVDHDTISLGWFFKDKAGIRYDILVPAIKLTSDPVSPAGLDQDVIEEIEFEAIRDPERNCMLQMDRFSSTDGLSYLV